MKHTEYIHWAKTRMGVRYNLARSGMTPCPLERLSPQDGDLQLSGDNSYGWVPLRERIAARYGVTAEEVVLAPGTSMANHLACATLLERGDRVLVEHPVYDPLFALPRYLGAEVEFFERRREDGYRLDVGAIADRATPGTRLVIISNYHNPTGAVTDEDTLGELARLAEQRDFYALVDEVYLEFLYDRRPKTAATLSPKIVTTRSLTKAYGLDGLRAGWIIAQPAVAERVRRLNDLFAAGMPHIVERLAGLALDRAGELLAATNAHLARNRVLVEGFLAGHPQLSWNAPEGGSIGLIRLEGGDVDALVDLLQAEYETVVVPGRFFGIPDAFRLGMGMETEVLEAGLERLGDALRRVAA